MRKHLIDAGAEVWIDHTRLAGGNTLWETIESAIEDADYFVPVLSHHSLTSQWFHREVRKAYAMKRDATIPVRVVDTLEIEEFPKWIAEKLVPLISETDKILKALEFYKYENVLRRARTHYRRKRFQQACETFADAIRKTAHMPADNARDSRLFIELSYAQEAAGDTRSAIESATEAINILPTPEAFLCRAKYSYNNRDLEIAAEDFRACLRLDPQNASALNGLGVAIFQDKHRKETLEQIASIFRRGIEACTQLNHEKSGSCSTDLSFKLDIHLGHVLERRSLEHADHRMELLQQAAHCFREATHLNPQDQTTRFSWAYMDHQLGNLGPAIAN